MLEEQIIIISNLKKNGVKRYSTSREDDRQKNAKSMMRPLDPNPTLPRCTFYCPDLLGRKGTTKAPTKQYSRIKSTIDRFHLTLRDIGKSIGKSGGRREREWVKRKTINN